MTKSTLEKIISGEICDGCGTPNPNEPRRRWTCEDCRQYAKAVLDTENFEKHFSAAECRTNDSGLERECSGGAT